MTDTLKPDSVRLVVFLILISRITGIPLCWRAKFITGENSADMVAIVSKPKVLLTKW
ncbi:MAG: hypothetical protein J6Z13_07625 [Clostridia bacterium]|nr:hypothetical protein [Clostridia bacterium]